MQIYWFYSGRRPLADTTFFSGSLASGKAPKWVGAQRKAALATKRKATNQDHPTEGTAAKDLKLPLGFTAPSPQTHHQHVASDVRARGFYSLALVRRQLVDVAFAELDGEASFEDEAVAGDTSEATYAVYHGLFEGGTPRCSNPLPKFGRPPGPSIWSSCQVGGGSHGGSYLTRAGRGQLTYAK